MFDLDAALHELLRAEGSDLHLKVPAPPLMRAHGRLRPLEGGERLTPDDTEGVLRQILQDPQKLREFEEDNEVDFAHSIPGLARFRVNAFRQRGAVSLVMRAIPMIIRSVDDLGLPPVICRLADEERGIILVTGTTGSGKSTTLAAMIDHINSQRGGHVITIEDPIEFLHRDKKSFVTQREVDVDTRSFAEALRGALR
ncbi:MAG: Flp pilus assembly complex ATPase component TadA, partial [Thermoleophilia bacterium]|nr:Flp pilus assembly complex ATPase component TadA [Thermoleophilia bacterium]